MFRRNNDKVIMDYFERKIRNTLNELDSTIYKEQQRIVEEQNARGLLSSGMTAGAILQMINDKNISSCEKTIELIEFFQAEGNIILNDKQLDEIAELYTSYYTENYMNEIEKVYFTSIRRYIGGDVGRNIANNTIVENTPKAIQRFINEKISDIKTFNKISKDEPSVKVAKRAQLISIISLTITAIIGYFSVFYGK